MATMKVNCKRGECITYGKATHRSSNMVGQVLHRSRSLGTRFKVLFNKADQVIVCDVQSYVIGFSKVLSASDVTLNDFRCCQTQTASTHTHTRTHARTHARARTHTGRRQAATSPSAPPRPQNPSRCWSWHWARRWSWHWARPAIMAGGGHGPETSQIRTQPVITTAGHGQ